MCTYIRPKAGEKYAHTTHIAHTQRLFMYLLSVVSQRKGLVGKKKQELYRIGKKGQLRARTHTHTYTR